MHSPFPSRREAVRAAAAGLTIAWLPGCGGPLAEAAKPMLTAGERSILDAVCDTLLPGAAKAGVGDFVAAMLREEDRMLAYTLVGAPIPASLFYPAALKAIDRFSQANFGARFASIPAVRREEVIGAMLAPDAKGWEGPPAFIVYWALRSDAADAMFATEASYEALGVPYLAHIMPPTPW